MADSGGVEGSPGAGDAALVTSERIGDRLNGAPVISGGRAMHCEGVARWNKVPLFAMCRLGAAHNAPVAESLPIEGGSPPVGPYMIGQGRVLLVG